VKINRIFVNLLTSCCVNVLLLHLIYVHLPSGVVTARNLHQNLRKLQPFWRTMIHQYYWLRYIKSLVVWFLYYYYQY